MIDAQVAFWLITVGVIEIAAVGVALFMVFPQGHALHWLLRWGFALMVGGVVVQIIRSMHYLEHGAYPIDIFFPTWILKDIGIAMHVYYYGFIHPKECEV